MTSAPSAPRTLWRLMLLLGAFLLAPVVSFDAETGASTVSASCGDWLAGHGTEHSMIFGREVRQTRLPGESRLTEAQRHDPFCPCRGASCRQNPLPNAPVSPVIPEAHPQDWLCDLLESLNLLASAFSCGLPEADVLLPAPHAGRLERPPRV